MRAFWLDLVLTLDLRTRVLDSPPIRESGSRWNIDGIVGATGVVLLSVRWYARYYADIGLLEPVQVDKFTGYRFYSLEQMPRLTRILALRDLGFSLDQIGDLLDDGLTPDQIRGMLKLRRSEIEHELLIKNDEGHGFVKQENNFELYSRLEAFFAEHLGP